MDWILTVFVILESSIKGAVFGSTINKFIRNDSLSNAMPLDTTPIHLHSLPGCARTCRSSANCAGFYHSEIQQRCIIDVDVFTNFTFDSSASYYVKSGASTTINSYLSLAVTYSETSTTTSTGASPLINSTTMTSTITTTTTTPTTSTTTPTTSSTTSTSTTTPSTTTLGSSGTAISFTNCSTDYYEDILLIGSSGNYRLKIAHQGVSHTQARETCQNSGMSLFRANDQDKVDAVMDFLTSCTGYDKLAYWADAEKQIGEPGQPWKNSDGSAVLVSAWENNTPGSYPGEYCAILFRNSNYKLSDMSCSFTYYSSWGFVCE